MHIIDLMFIKINAHYSSDVYKDQCTVLMFIRSMHIIVLMFIKINAHYSSDVYKDQCTF